VFFDVLDGSDKHYKGANFRLFKATLDAKYSRYKQLLRQISVPVVELSNQLEMERGNFERIGVHAALQQKGGRQKLLDTDYTEAQIDEVKLTADELQVYQAMRDAYDELRPAIKEIMEVVYNAPLDEVEDYFPMMTDFEAMSDFEMRDKFGDRSLDMISNLRKNVEKGMTVTRTLGRQKIKINALEIFLQHVDNAAYLIETGADIKRLAEIAATSEYGAAVGEVAQKEVREWLDLAARKGKVERNKTVPILDTIRRHTGAAMIGFKLSSVFVNFTPFLDGAGFIGRYAFQGASDIATNPQWRAFLMKNMPELRERSGGDIEFMEFGASTLAKIEKAGFWPLQRADGLAASSIAAGAYAKYLDENGLKLDFENPSQAGIEYAQLIMRRTQSSAFFKDLPSAFTRGAFTGNKSFDRLIFQFQSFMMGRWSEIEHDMIRVGIKTKDVGQAMNIFFFLAMAGLAEMVLRRFTKEMLGMLTGDDPDKWSETFTEEMITNALQNVPFVSAVAGSYNYGNIPIPTISMAQEINEKFQAMKRTKDPDKKVLRILELLVQAGGTAAGLPGTSQASQIIRSASKTKKQQGLPTY